MMKKKIALVLASLLPVSFVHATDLMDIYQLAVKNDPLLQVESANHRVVEQNKAVVESAFGTIINLGGSVNVQRVDIQSSAINTSNNESAFLSLSKILLSAENDRKIEQTDVSIEQSLAAIKVLEQGLMLNVAQVYFNYLSAEDSLSFAKAENAAIARQLDQATQRFDVGLIAITDVHEAQAIYDQSNADLIGAETALDDAKEAIYEMTRHTVSDFAALQDELILSKPEPAKIDQWTQTAQQKNLSIKVALLGIEVAKKNVVVQQSGDSSTLTLVGSHNMARTSSNAGSNIDTTSIGLVFNLPLYQGGRVQANVKKSLYEMEAAQQLLDQRRRSVRRQVRDAYRAIVASMSQVTALKASTRSSKSALEAIKAGFDVGTRTIVDVLNAERDVYRSMSRLSQLRYNYILNGLSLKLAAGTLSEGDLKQVNGWLMR